MWKNKMQKMKCEKIKNAETQIIFSKLVKKIKEKIYKRW